MIKLTNIHKSFGKLEVLKGIDIDFSQSGISAVLGPNGSGKTTLIKSMLGMVLPDQGSIEISGKEVRRSWEYREEIGYLPQIARFPENLTVRELLAMVQDLRKSPAHPDPLIERFGIGDKINARLGHLSGGTRQKVNLVQAFMFDSPILMLDEPTSGLDPVAIIELKSLLNEAREAGKTILITTHVMAFVEEMADEIVFLLEGKVHFRGTKTELLKKSQEPDIERAIASLLRPLESKPSPPASNTHTLNILAVPGL